MFNISFLISTVWAQPETPERYNRPISEVTDSKIRALRYLEDNKGRQLFTRSNVSIGGCRSDSWWYYFNNGGPLFVGVLATLVGIEGDILSYCSTDKYTLVDQRDPTE